MKCIFCKIVSKDIPSKIVFEDDNLIAIEDLSPQAPVHILIFPKRHYTSLMDCDDKDLLGKMLLTARMIAEEKGVHEKGFRTVINTREWGGQTVHHLHMHLLAGKPLSGRLG
ncbi:MAG: histidine triad nucleotide-binding protein [Thermodesulfobacteriota bacterium]